MRRTTLSVLSALLLAASAALAATVTIVNTDGAGEGFNDPTVVSPVGGNPGTTLGEQRLYCFQAAADQWGSLLYSPVEIRIEASFDPLECYPDSGVLGASTTPYAIRNFPNAPVSNTWYHPALANSLAGYDLSAAQADIITYYNSAIDDDPNCLGGLGWYYGVDGVPGNQYHLYPTLLHEMAHGLGFKSYANYQTGTLMSGIPDIWTLYIYDTTVALHWNQMTNAQRIASAKNPNNVVWDAPLTRAASEEYLWAYNSSLVMDAGTYAAYGAAFGGAWGEVNGTAGTLELVNDGTATPTFACAPLVGFTPGNIAFIDRGTCEFGLKVWYAQQAGAAGAVVANNTGGTALLRMGPGAVGHMVNIPAISIGQNDGNTVRPTLPLPGSFTVTTAEGVHAATGYPTLFTPATVEPGSTLNHFNTTFSPDALMEPYDTPGSFDEVDITPALFEDIGWTVYTPMFEDGFESADPSAWDASVN